jgi:hypothetical protein
MLLSIISLGSTSICFAQRDLNNLPEWPAGPAFGARCGFVGVDPEPRVAIENLITFKDTATIFQWLEDKDPVIQTYAAEAVIRLKRTGMMIPDRKLVRVSELKRSKTQIKVCSGCTYWMEDIGSALRDSISVNNIR